MRGTKGNWNDLNVPWHWTEVFQDGYPDPEIPVYLFYSGSIKKAIEWHNVNWSAGFETDENAGFTLEMKLIDALGTAERFGWLLAEGWAMRD